MIKQSLLEQIDKENLPRHIAVIMDGNGRWAKKKHLPRIIGHRNGVKVVDKIVTQCRKLNIQALTLYAFSSENWSRPAGEVKILMSILKDYLKKETQRMLKEEIRFNTIGDIESFPPDVRKVIAEVKEKTAAGDKMVLTLALSYGSQQEIIRAVKLIAEKVKKDELEVNNIDISLFEDFLYTHDLPPADLLIRTSGELRLSNFLLWQLAYTELYFLDKFWPDFSEEDLFAAIIDFQKRERRYGLTAEQISSQRNK